MGVGVVNGKQVVVRIVITAVVDIVGDSFEILFSVSWIEELVMRENTVNLPSIVQRESPGFCVRGEVAAQGELVDYELFPNDSLGPVGQ